jgi:hypothetical protein
VKRARYLYFKCKDAFAVLALIVCVARANADDARNEARYFLGSWTCVTQIPANGSTAARTLRTAWTFAPLSAGSGWIRIVYGDPASPDGTAVVGYVSELKKFVYRDFHADGSYADISSAAPVDGRWVWTGPYYPAAGGVLNGRIVYTMVSPTRYDRSFESVVDGKAVAMGGDTCTKAP